MLVYSYKNNLYASLKDCIEENNIIKLPSIQSLSNDLLKKLKIEIIDLINDDLNIFIKQQQEKIKLFRNNLLKESDKYVLPDYPITQIDLLSIMTYRQYLRDYTKQEEWWKQKPLLFEEWHSENNNLYYK